MKKLWIVGLIVLSLLISAGAAVGRDLPEQPAPEDGPVVVRLYVRDKAHLDAVAGELDIWETHPEENYVVASVKPAEHQWLQDLGYRLEIDAEKTAEMGIQAPLDPRFYYFDDYYVNSNDRYMVDFLQDTETAHPELTELSNIGDAWMAGQPGEHARDMWVLRISNEDPSFGAIQDKPVFFLFSGIHAREVAIPELAIRYVKYLTEGYNGEGGYGIDPDVTWLVNHNVLYLLLDQNPDGHWKNEENTGNNRRKNMNWTDGCSDPSSWGVDLNRNHSFMWGCCGGSSGSPCSETYRGSSRGSEPETQAFQNYLNTVMIDQNGPNGDTVIPPAAPPTTTGIFITLHSYSDLVLWPWGFDNYGNPPNYAELEKIGRKFAYFTNYDPVGTIWYDVDGATDDHVYGKLGVAAFTFEVGPQYGSCGGFFPDYECLEGEGGRPENFWAENKPAFLYAHKIARTPYLTGYGPDAEDLLVTPDDVAPGTPVDLEATITDHRYGGDPLLPLTAAEYFIDAPGEDGTGIAMTPSDGSWGEQTEEVEAVIDTAGLAPGRHYLLVHGQNNSGNWGPFSAVFLTVTLYSDSAIAGYVLDEGTGDPIDQAELGLFGGGEPQYQVTGPDGAFGFQVMSGTYTLTAEAANYYPAVLEEVVAQTGMTTTVTISLTRFFTGTLHGIVFDGMTEWPLSATVTALSSHFAFTTTTVPTTGIYSLVMPGGTYTVTASSSGYLAETVHGILVEPGEITVQDFGLMRALENRLYLPLIER